MEKSEKLKLCRQCRDNFYNLPGNSNTGECWSLEQAEPVERMLVGVWQNPPYIWSPQTTLSCCRPQGSVFIRREDVRVIEKEQPCK